jgi:hypothetical protein
MTELEEGSTPTRRPRRPRAAMQALAFAGVLVAGVLIGWVVFRDDDSLPAAATTTIAGVPVLSDARAYPKLGITLSLPKRWTTSFRSSVLTAVSPDDTVSVALSAAGGSGDGQRIRRSDRTVRARRVKARELSRPRAKVGTATTIVTELIGRARNGRPIRILSMGASSRWRTYSIQAFMVPQPRELRLAEIRTLLASLRFREPS